MSFRGVAQSGRVLALGARCRRFESFRPDQKITNDRFGSFFIFPRDADSNLVLIFPSLWHATTAGHSWRFGRAMHARTYSLSPRPWIIQSRVFTRLFLCVARNPRGFAFDIDSGIRPIYENPPQIYPFVYNGHFRGVNGCKLLIVGVVYDWPLDVLLYW